MDLTGWRNAKRPAVPAPVQRRKSFASLRRPTDCLEQALTYNVDSPAKFRKLDASPSKNTTLVVFGEEAHDAPEAAPAALDRLKEIATILLLSVGLELLMGPLAGDGQLFEN